MHTRDSNFRRCHYPRATRRNWDDWRWQLRNMLRTAADLARVLALSDDERRALRRTRGALPVGITPYYAGLLDPADPAQPLRRTVVPTHAEFIGRPGEYRDPLGEERHGVAPGLIHTYPDKVLFLVTDRCAGYCRYCTRARLVGRGKTPCDRAAWEAALDYIARTKRIRDVLLSGGEPLILSDGRLDWLLARLRRIPHVEIVRMSTKVPAFLPQRVTPGLVRMLRRHHPLWLSLHFTHPDELTPEASRACERLADGGIPLCSQTVLLAGVNDDADTMRRLMLGLLRVRVKPYYLHQCDAVRGASHFRTPVSKGLEIIRGLHGHTTGYAVPTYVIDAPGGGGKVPLMPDYLVRRLGDDLVLRNYRGELYRYADAPWLEQGQKGRSSAGQSAFAKGARGA